MKQKHALSLALVSGALIIDMHFTHFIAGLGVDFVALSKVLGALSYLNLIVAISLGFISPALMRKAERTSIQVVIEDNSLTVNGTRSEVLFSKGAQLIYKPLVFEIALREAINATINPSVFTLKPVANVVVCLGGRPMLSDEDSELIESVTREMFLKVDLGFR